MSPASARSVLDRANDLFHFEKAIRGDALPPLDIPAEMIPPPPPEPMAAPVPGPMPAETVNDAAGKAIVAARRARDWNGPAQTLDRDAMAEAGFLVPGAPITRTGEEFRIIKRELLARIRGSRQQEAIPNGNIILVASAHAGDGKTFCSVNLALSLAAETGLEILLIDADFAKAEIASTLGLTPGKGMMDALADPHLPVDELVIRTDVPSFFVLPAGQGNDKDAEYLASSRMEAVIAALVAGRPDRVLIFDSPPLLAASPAAALAAHVGQTVLVVRADRTSESALRDAAGLLKECQHVQLLLNGVKFSPSGRRFGSYYGVETD
ncbi:MAG: AAA family ATPase [Sphingobium sp.]